jgi:hypothetical protein
MRATRFLHAATIMGAIALIPRVASPQLAGSVVFTPFAGAYVPANDLAKVIAPSSTLGASAAARQKSASAFGGNLSYWLNERVAVEGGAVYAKSDIKWSGTIGESGNFLDETVTRNAHVWMASTKLLFQLFPRESEYNMRFGVGPALITRSGPAFKPDNGTFSGLTDLGTALSLCTRLSITPNFGLRMRAEDYMYRSRLSFRGNASPDRFNFDRKMQNDVLFSTGVQIFLSR